MPSATHLQEIFATVPWEIGRKVFPVHVHAFMSAEALLVTVQDDLILARCLDTDPVVDE